MMGFLVFAASIIQMFFSAWVISMLWGWFLVPLGVPPINVLHALGISFMWSMLGIGQLHLIVQIKQAIIKPDTAEQSLAHCFQRIVMTLIVLLVGWLCQMFM